jgi:hypothetical protein
VANHIYTLVPSFNTAGQFAQSVFHYQFDDAGFSTTKAAASALIAAFDAARRTSLRACLPTDVTLISYRSAALNAVGGFNAFVPVTSTNVGTRTGTQSASALNPVVVHYPLTPSQGRGKWFIPGVAEADIEDGRYTNTYASAITTILSTLFDPLTLTGGGGPTATFGWFARSANAFRQPVVSLLSLNLGTQRRRMRPAG